MSAMLGVYVCQILNDKNVPKMKKKYLKSKILQMVIAAMKLKDAYSLEGKL